MKETNITVLMVEPGKNPTLITIKNDLDSLQKANVDKNSVNCYNECTL